MFRILKWLEGLFAGDGPGLVETHGVKELRQIEDWKACLAASKAAPLFVFKHSTVCPTSAAAHRRVAQYLEEREAGSAPVYLVRVIEARPVSNAIAEDLGVRHQSPQILLVHDGRAIWNASHGGVSESAMRSAWAACRQTGGT